MGFYRALIQATPHSMSGGFYSSSWQAAKEEVAGYLSKIKFNTKITSLNISNLIPNNVNLSDVNYPDFPVFGSGTNINNVNGINISNYNKLYLNSDCSNMFAYCHNCTDWSGLNLFDWTYVTNCVNMFIYADNLNHPVKIGNNVENCVSMFNECMRFNQPIVIPESVVNCANMFVVNQGTSWGNADNIVPVPDVYFKGKNFRNINIRQMVGRTAAIDNAIKRNNTRGIRVNIYYNVVIENQILNKSGTNTLTGTSLTWTAMENGYYNESANIYLYNNYEG